MKKLFVMLSLCFFVSKCCGQYSFNASATGTITIGPSLSMTYTNLAGTFSVSSVTDYQNGISTNNCATIAISANVPWVIKVSANSSVFTATGGGASSNMPASVVGVRVNGSSSYISLTTSQQTLNTGNSGTTSTSGNTFNMDVKLNPGFSYAGGSYSLGLVYTLTAQ